MLIVYSYCRFGGILAVEVAHSGVRASAKTTLQLAARSTEVSSLRTTEECLRLGFHLSSC